jgi:probable DNA repair protein
MNLPGPIADALLRGSTVVAASPRASRALHLQYADAQRAAGREVWPAPAILDWDAWLRALWQDHAFANPDAPLLLTSLQERALWTRIQHEEAVPVISPESMAALAMEAWSLLSAFNAHPARRTSWDSTLQKQELNDAESFRRWADLFEQECARNQWLSPAQLASALIPLLPSLDLPREICLVGFDRTTPAQRDLLAALQSCSIAVTHFQPDAAAHPAPQSSAPDWLLAPDHRAEIAACAQWIRNQLLANPQARIGVIAPSIADSRGLIDRIFRGVLLPAADIRQPSPLVPWEFSLGQPLAEVPVIRAALLLLHWLAAPLPNDHISWLLLSGFVASSGTNSSALARHDAAHRGQGLLSPQQSLAACRASIAGRPELAPLHQHLSAILQAAHASQLSAAPRPPSAWTELIPHLLERAAWPGPLTPDSVQFQALQRWQRLLDEIALLDFDGSRLSFAEFLTLLQRAAADSIFAPESHDAPIQILGPLESSGQHFDALWFLQTDDTRWPQSGRLHPLLPPSLQRHYGMPHATPDDDWTLAQTVTARLLASAPRIVFSSAQREKDAELRPSPLIASLFPPQTQPQLLAIALAPPSRRVDEPIPEEPPIPWPDHRVPGGADVLKKQAACPFQSFAALRLAAQPIESAAWGLSPIDKGRLLHKILETLFRDSIHSHRELVTAADTQELDGILDSHIDAALAAHPCDPADPWQQACLEAEKRRLHARLNDWLAVEIQRHPFTVEACEQKLPGVHIGDLPLHLRADRIARLHDGTHLLIDYKTGDVSPAAWRGERPDEPQLPLYAAYGNVPTLSGVLFAKIRPGETGFDGRIRDARSQLSATVSPSSAIAKDPYTPALRDQWATVLRALAGQFLSGESAIDPRDSKVCGQCGYHALCRIAELRLPAADEDPEEEDSDD